jgi:hypothetical protein
MLLKLTNPNEMTPLEFLENLIQASRNDALRNQLQLLKEFYNKPVKPDMSVVVRALGTWRINLIFFLNNFLGGTFQLKAIEGFPCAVWCFINRWNEPEEAVIDAVSILIPLH